MTIQKVSIHYRRLPGQIQVFEQIVLEESPKVVVTFLDSALLNAPVNAGGSVILEPGSPVVWFTYPDRWYDVGRFHLADGTFTGTYMNIITPVVMAGDRWETTDLCLDVWLEADGSVMILDEADFEEAVREGWIDAATATVARRQAETIATAARAGAWPPAHVESWSLEQARARVAALHAEV